PRELGRSAPRPLAQGARWPQEAHLRAACPLRGDAQVGVMNDSASKEPALAQQIYNTLTGQKEPLEPLVPGKVRIYVCGPTVYDLSHIGHARAYVAFDVVVRYLRRRYEVLYVRNYTDVDDKIIKRAGEVGEAPGELSERFVREFEADMQALGVEAPDIAPKV